MSAEQSHMMTLAHATTGGALGVILVIFALGVGLFFWSRPRR